MHWRIRVIGRISGDRRISASAFLVFLAVFAVSKISVASAATDIRVVDDMGKIVSLPAPAQRIIALSPHVTELVFSAGGGAKVVGVVDYSDYPESAVKIAHVGSANALDLERIVSLRPDLVIGWRSGNPQSALERLNRLGMPVFLSEPRKLEDIPTNIERIGALMGTAEVAGREAARFREEARQLGERYSGRPPVRVFYQIWDRPLITVNGDHMISAVLKLCGGENIFGDLRALAPEISVESVLERNPEVIMVGGSATEHNQTEFWSKWPLLSAVKNGRVFRLPPDHMQRQTARILLGAGRVCELLESVRVQRAGR